MRKLFIEPIFYVYVHVRKDTGRIFYVGKGKGHRAWVTNRRNPHWKNIVKKSGYDIVILRDFMTEEAAMFLEIEMIAALGMENLCNLTIGGDGAAGYKMSEENKEALSKRMTGVVFSEERRERISKALTGRKRDRAVVEAHTEKIRGKKHSQETIEKRRLTLIGRPVSDETRLKMSKTHTGKIISEEAKKNMAKAQIGKKRSEESIEKQRQTMLARIAVKKNEMYGSQMKPVLCSNGMRFDSITLAAEWANREFGKTKAKYAIGATIKRNGTLYGLRWSYL